MHRCCRQCIDNAVIVFLVAIIYNRVHVATTCRTQSGLDRYQIALVHRQRDLPPGGRNQQDFGTPPTMENLDCRRVYKRLASERCGEQVRSRASPAQSERVCPEVGLAESCGATFACFGRKATVVARTGPLTQPAKETMFRTAESVRESFGNGTKAEQFVWTPTVQQVSSE